MTGTTEKRNSQQRDKGIGQIKRGYWRMRLTKLTSGDLTSNPLQQLALRIHARFYPSLKLTRKCHKIITASDLCLKNSIH